MDWILPKMMKYTNLNHTCPYNGYVFLKVDNISLNDFAFPQLIPAGRYRTHISVQESDDKILFNASLYFSVSDHRLVVV